MKMLKTVGSRIFSLLKDDAPLGKAYRIKSGYLVRTKCLELSKYTAQSPFSPGYTFPRAKGIAYALLVAGSALFGALLSVLDGSWLGMVFPAIAVGALLVNLLTGRLIARYFRWEYIIVYDDDSAFQYVGRGSAVGKAKRNSSATAEGIGLTDRKEVSSGREYELARELVGRLDPKFALLM